MPRFWAVLSACVLLGFFAATGCPPAPPVSSPGIRGNGGTDTGISLTVNLNGVSRRETGMTTHVYFGSAAITRADAGTGRFTPQVCQATAAGEGTCTFDAGPGSVATIIAIEDLGGTRNLTTPSVLPPETPSSAVEFVRFEGLCDASPEAGVCIMTLSTSREITVDYAAMPSITFQQIGAGAANITISAPPPLRVPPVEANPLNTVVPIRLTPRCVSPFARPVFQIWLHSGSAVGFTVAPADGLLFRGWQDACAGAGIFPICDMALPAREAVATARFQRYDCTFEGTPCSATLIGSGCFPVEP